MQTLFIILLYLIASFFVVLSFLMLFAFRRTQRWEFVLMSSVYAMAGMFAGYLRMWWPIVAGIMLAWMLKKAGFDPDAPPPRPTDEAGPSDKAP